MLDVGVSTYWRAAGGRIHMMFHSWGEGALIHFKYASQKGCVSGRAGTGRIGGRKIAQDDFFALSYLNDDK